MTATITQGATLVAFSNGNQYIFYGENARKAATVLRLRTESNGRGMEYLLIRERQRDIVEPQLVAAGYRIAILEA